MIFITKSWCITPEVVCFTESEGWWCYSSRSANSTIYTALNFLLPIQYNGTIPPGLDLKNNLYWLQFRCSRFGSPAQFLPIRFEEVGATPCKPYADSSLTEHQYGLFALKPSSNSLSTGMKFNRATTQKFIFHNNLNRSEKEHNRINTSFTWGKRNIRLVTMVHQNRPLYYSRDVIHRWSMHVLWQAQLWSV